MIRLLTWKLLRHHDGIVKIKTGDELLIFLKVVTRLKQVYLELVDHGTGISNIDYFPVKKDKKI